MIAGTVCCTALLKLGSCKVGCGCGWTMQARSYREGKVRHHHHLRLVKAAQRVNA